MTAKRFYSHQERADYLASLKGKDAYSRMSLEMAKLAARFYPGPLTYKDKNSITPSGGPMVGDSVEYLMEWGKITRRYERRLAKEKGEN